MHNRANVEGGGQGFAPEIASEGGHVVYLYDGTFDGLLCVAGISLAEGKAPAGILLADEAQLTMYETRRIETDAGLARETAMEIRRRISRDALDLVKRAFLTCLESRELAILAFLRRGFREGGSLMRRLTAPEVAPLLRAVGHLTNEAEKYRGFIRFSDLGGALVSVISPLNQVLPLLAPHFCGRFPDETLLIYDRTHRAFLLCDRGTGRLGYMDEFEPSEADTWEKNYRALWQSFYNAIAVRERYNPRCRMGHMPKRYWEHMTEFWEREAFFESNTVAKAGPGDIRGTDRRIGPAE